MIPFIFWLSFCLLVFIYLGYPLSIGLLASVRRRGIHKDETYQPMVSILIAAHNEEADIEATLQNKIEQDYPQDRLEILVVSDESEDQTDSIVSRFAKTSPVPVRLFRQVPRQGKTSGLNSRVPEARGEILVFSDANSRWAPDAVAKLVCNFADAQVGYVTGKMVYTNEDGSLVGDGYSHQLVYTQKPEVFREETLRSKRLLEDRIGQAVQGYRAASYSITAQSRWALDILCEAGFTWDSSIFPVHHDRYGMPGTPHWPYKLQALNGDTLTEFPLSTCQVAGYRLPIAGGGYFRLFPYWLTKWGLGSINREDRPFIFYLHPWEVDPEQSRMAVSLKSRFRHYNNLHRCYGRLERLLADFRFGAVGEVLERLSIAPEPVSV